MTKAESDIEFWAVYAWRSASICDGKSCQYDEWRSVRNWLWGYREGTRSKRAYELADFLSYMAMERGVLK